MVHSKKTFLDLLCSDTNHCLVFKVKYVICQKCIIVTKAGKNSNILNLAKHVDSIDTVSDRCSVYDIISSLVFFAYRQS